MTAIKTAMVLAAGLGTRMRPLTDRTPKALIQVRSRTLLDHALDRLVAHGVDRVVVNAHWLADKVVAHLATRTDVALEVIREPALLETGGGVRNALPLLGKDPVFVINADALWLDGLIPVLERLEKAWLPAEMDALLLLHRSVHTSGYNGPGDFFADPNGLLTRRRDNDLAPYVFAGVHICTPSLVASEPAEAFSMNRVWDRIQENGRLYGLVHDGLWFHLSEPADLRATERYLDQRFPDRLI